MNKCPQCGTQRKADEYRCPACGCFYSRLDEILASEETEREKKSFKGRLKAIMKADNPKLVLIHEIQNTPPRTLFTFIVIFVFIFALIVSVL